MACRRDSRDAFYAFTFGAIEIKLNRLAYGGKSSIEKLLFEFANGGSGGRRERLNEAKGTMKGNEPKRKDARTE